MRVLIVGSGGREHALAWKLSQSPLLEELHAAPGNPGIAALGQCHPVRADDGEGLLGLARALEIELAVIGPEAPLVAGVADELRHAGIAAFGPSAAAARIEGSKSFAKEVLAAAGVPTATTLTDPRPPCVVKADGLAAGKGVFVCTTQEELDAGLAAAAALGGPLVVEERLEGVELSVFALTDGSRALPLAAARDYKRLGEGGTGPNTGGMGAFSPVPPLDERDVGELVDQIHRPVLAELAARRTPFLGLLYAGLMLTEDGPRVLEFNCRFGDPETQAILPRLDGDLLAALAAAAGGDLRGVTVGSTGGAAVTVVLAAGSYPDHPDVGSRIDGVPDAEELGALVFHAGTAQRDGELMTSGGRILNVTGVGSDLEAARARAYEAAAAIAFNGVRYRRDVALEEARVLG
ncbi:MAG TPA: phosphoribosylamine--glycine ligase [Gaiellaceae bacterium]|nr:phosphoribosylamine--glycine ligase [Gaiellaceae bacterium]